MINIRKILGIVSLWLAVLQFLLFISFFLYRSSTLQGLPVLLPVFLAPIGIILGAIGYSGSEANKQAKNGIIFNVIMFLLLIVYMTLGTLLFGP
ncbi:hypothetical protein [Paenibacillus aestuarii]|uniref:DUF4190 domain-containing protein n=1 Tax=Paenibacillus aestuarii TaxID=516965 RepID=A0ABW0K9M4_9BACL|nr:hypothetical protein [Paenibacillus aestuarii]